MHPLHLDLLRALFRLHRYRRTADLAALELRVPLNRVALRDAVRGLERAGAVTFDGREARLTLVGLALAAASAGAKRKARSLRVAA
jgi:hypothetical protein